jgi:three-Cys-motif partner protein
MSKSKSTRQDEIGPWSEDKLILLAKYLRAYSVIMNRQKDRGYFTKYHYIDAFAGAVYARAKNYDPDQEVTRYVEGSPLRALQTEPPFDVCWFVDLSTGRSQKLTELESAYPERDIRVRRGDCNTVLRSEIIAEVTRPSRQRGVVFLDPYGLQVEWGTIQALAKAGTFDVFVNFPIMGITRILKRDEMPDEEARSEISRIMGDSDWLDTLYQPSSQPDIWGIQPIERDVMQAAWLAEQYASRVRNLFQYVSEPLIMYNTRNAPLYALFLASHKEVATRIVNEITIKYQTERAERQQIRPSRRVTKIKGTQQDTVQTSFMDEVE